MTEILIAPSILAADFLKLGDEIRAVEKAGADVIHLDIMDGHFVPNITFGPDLVRCIRKATKLPIDCHLMLEEPEKYINSFAEAGADMISIHAETSDIKTLCTKIRRIGKKAGIAINPPYRIKKIEKLLEYADFVLIMTVFAGFGGQKMIEECVQKISDLKEIIDKKQLLMPIEVDGGITKDNVSKVINAGAKIIVAGTEIFKSSNYKTAIDNLKKR